MSPKKATHLRTKTPKKIHKRSGFTKVFPIIVAVLVLLVAGAGIATFKDPLAAWWYSTVTVQLNRRIPQPTPPPRPIAHGKQNFTVGGLNIQGPRFISGFVDPYDPAQNTNQNIQVTVSSNVPVTSVYGIIHSDHKTQIVPFTLTAGDAVNGTWKSTWLVNDTYLYMYNEEIHAISAQGSNSVVITNR